MMAINLELTQIPVSFLVGENTTVPDLSYVYYIWKLIG